MKKLQSTLIVSLLLLSATSVLSTALATTRTPGSVVFVGSDTTTKGNWIGTYGHYAHILPGSGAQEFVIESNMPTTPSPFTYVMAGSSYTINGTTVTFPTYEYNWKDWNFPDPRAAQYVVLGPHVAPNTRLSSWDDGGERGWPNNSYFDVILTFPNGNYRLSLYTYDYERTSRDNQNMIIMDQTHTVLDSKVISGTAFDEGIYLTWSVSGPTTIIARMQIGMNGAVRSTNAILSGIFVDADVPSTYLESASSKFQSGTSWSSTVDASAVSGTVMEASSSSPNNGCLYGPYITKGLDGSSLLGQTYAATFRLKTSSNMATSNIVHLDVCCNLGNSILSQMTIKATDFTASNAWQDFNLIFTVPSSLTAGVEFRVVNLNNGMTDAFVDQILVKPSPVYSESASNKLKTGSSWSSTVDASSVSGTVMEASSSSPNYGCLYGPYITKGLDESSLLGKTYTATFRLKTSSNSASSNIVNIDVCCNLGSNVLQQTKLRASDFTASNTWQDFKLVFSVPSSLTAGVEFRVQNLNNGIANIYVDQIKVEKVADVPLVYFESASSKFQSGTSWSSTVDASSVSGTVMEASSSSPNNGCLYGPYITKGLDGSSLLGQTCVATFRLKTSSNSATSNIVHLDVCCNLGNSILSQMTIKATDFTASNAWQDFNLIFTTPSSVTGGVEFRVQNLNNGIADVYVDQINVK